MGLQGGSPDIWGRMDIGYIDGQQPLPQPQELLKPLLLLTRNTPVSYTHLTLPTNREV